MKNPRFKTGYLLLLLFFSFGWMIDKSEAQNKNPFLSLTEEQLLSLPGKSIKDSLVQALLNNKNCKWEFEQPHYSATYFSKDSSRKNSLNLDFYESRKYGFRFEINHDSVSNISLFNYTERENGNYIALDNYRPLNNKKYNKYKGIVPFGLKFSMNPFEVEKKLNEQCPNYNYKDQWICKDVKVYVAYDTDVLSEAKISYIDLWK